MKYGTIVLSGLVFLFASTGSFAATSQGSRGNDSASSTNKSTQDTSMTSKKQQSQTLSSHQKKAREHAGAIGNSASAKTMNKQNAQERVSMLQQELDSSEQALSKMENKLSADERRETKEIRNQISQSHATSRQKIDEIRSEINKEDADLAKIRESASAIQDQMAKAEQANQKLMKELASMSTSKKSPKYGSTAD